jgi:NCAIR mutase (PurE)-related protein
LLENIKTGATGIDSAISKLKDFPFEDLGFAKVDHHRELRQGFPEVIFGEGKTPQQISSIASAILSRSGRVLITRANNDAFKEVESVHPNAIYDNSSRIITISEVSDNTPGLPGVLVACAGTSDLPVATEASITAEMMGCDVKRIFDVGVAGIHRLFDKMDDLNKARVIVAVAGMEGALPSVIGGLVNVPIIAVPTSIGYGASFGGIAALLAMLNSCAPGIGVVNIDNGFGAGYLAANIVLSSTPKH